MTSRKNPMLTRWSLSASSQCSAEFFQRKGGRDFNNIRRPKGKTGRNSHPRWLMEGFNNTILRCGLSELEFSDHQLTWERGIGTPNWVVERLDRILVFDAWMDFFGGAKAMSCETPVCASYLPTADLLQIHIVNCDNLCPLCEFAAETSMHLFTLCPFDISSWNLSSLISHVISSSSLDEWIAQFLKALNSDSKCLFMLIYWYIWQSRNDKICNSQTTSPTTTVYKVKVKSHFSEWTFVNEKEVANTPTQQHFITKWEKPNTGWVKINVDGAADTQRRRMGIGWLIRDDKGAFLKVSLPPRTLLKIQNFSRAGLLRKISCFRLSKVISEVRLNRRTLDHIK
nr:putative ribonuclease H-like domain, reverse transcriptase zinc-binding domain-containing protein [Ipomoea batatas]